MTTQRHFGRLDFPLQRPNQNKGQRRANDGEAEYPGLAVLNLRLLPSVAFGFFAETHNLRTLATPIGSAIKIFLAKECYPELRITSK